MKKTLEPKYGLSPNPVALVTSGDKENTDITTIAWTGILNSEPMIVYVSIRPIRYANELIRKNMEFTINLPGKDLVKEADFCGTKSGREVDKFDKCNLTKVESTKVSVPYIKECPISLECKVIDIKSMPSHDVFKAEVVAVNADEEILDENGNIDFAKAKLLTFAGKQYFSNDEEVGTRGIGFKAF